jgi:N-acetyl sugar amidotransferase
MQERMLTQEQRDQALQTLVNNIKKEGKRKKYDCIIGVSGGVDSTTVAYTVKKLGLRPLAVHFDNGWDSELAVCNIQKTLEKLSVDLFTYVVDWEEFVDLQMSFIKADVVNCEAPTDHGITATLFRTAHKEGVRYILSGSNLATEAIMPITWAYYNQDLRNLKAIHRRYGMKPLRTFPTISVLNYLYYILVRKMRQIPFLNYISYNKQSAKKMLTEEIGWRDYGGKHYESVWTRFYQGYYLPQKFGIDKRRAHLSTLICSHQISREEALEEMKKPPYDANLLREDMAYIIKKFGLTQEEFSKILNAPPKQHYDYPSNYFLFHKMIHYKNIFRNIATTT